MYGTILIYTDIYKTCISYKRAQHKHGWYFLEICWFWLNEEKKKNLLKQNLKILSVI